LFSRSSASINLPSMPISISKIINMTTSEDVTIEKLAEVVLMDQTLTSRVLRLANSVMYARRQKTGTVTEAVIRLGSSQLRNLAASASVLDAVFPKKSFPGFDWKEMWNHSVTCAVASQCAYSTITGAIRNTDESAFIAGLLHDVGKMVIAYALPMKFAEIVAKCCADDWDMNMSEKKFLATDHATVGAKLATEWQLPEKLQIGINYHHNPEAAPEEIEIARAVCAGNLLAKRLSKCYIFGQNWDVSLDQVGEAAQLSKPDVARVVSDTREGLMRCSEIISWGDNLPVPKKMAA